MTQYAITFGMDTETLKRDYPGDDYMTAHADISKTLQSLGFTCHPCGGLYFGEKTVNAVDCVLATQKLNDTYPWFKASVRDMLMLRIEETDDLLLTI